MARPCFGIGIGGMWVTEKAVCRYLAIILLSMSLHAVAASVRLLPSGAPQVRGAATRPVAGVYERGRAEGAGVCAGGLRLTEPMAAVW